MLPLMMHEELKSPKTEVLKQGPEDEQPVELEKIIQVLFDEICTVVDCQTLRSTCKAALGVPWPLAVTRRRLRLKVRVSVLGGLKEDRIEALAVVAAMDGGDLLIQATPLLLPLFERSKHVDFCLEALWRVVEWGLFEDDVQDIRRTLLHGGLAFRLASSLSWDRVPNRRRAIDLARTFVVGITCSTEEKIDGLGLIEAVIDDFDESPESVLLLIETVVLGKHGKDRIAKAALRSGLLRVLAKALESDHLAESPLKILQSLAQDQIFVDSYFPKPPRKSEKKFRQRSRTTRDNVLSAIVTAFRRHSKLRRRALRVLGKLAHFGDTVVSDDVVASSLVPFAPLVLTVLAETDVAKRPADALDCLNALRFILHHDDKILLKKSDDVLETTAADALNAIPQTSSDINAQRFRTIAYWAQSLRQLISL